MRHYLVILMFCFFSSSVWADGYQQELNEFFALFEAGKKSESIDRLYQTNPWVSQAADDIIKVKTQLASLDSMVGKYLGKELIHTNNVKNRFVQVTYLALYERQPVRLEFQFYKPKETWIVYAFSFDTDFDSDVKSVSRAQAANGSGL